jgi:hypothetical protein
LLDWRSPCFFAESVTGVHLTDLLPPPKLFSPVVKVAVEVSRYISFEPVESKYATEIVESIGFQHSDQKHEYMGFSLLVYIVKEIFIIPTEEE